MSSATHPDPIPSSPQGRAEDKAHSNGAPPTKPATRIPERAPGRPRKFSLYLWIGGIGAVILLMIGAGFMLRRSILREPYTGPVWTVVKEKLRVTIVERGALESAENSDITCRVKAKSQGSTIASTIKWVVEDGTEVKAGDKLIDLDDSGFQETLKTQRNIVNDAFAKWVEMKTNCTFQDIENESTLETAKVNKIQMELEFQKYAGNIAGDKMAKIETREELRKYLLNGFEKDVVKESAQAADTFTSAYFADVSDFKGKIETARSDLESWLDRAAWSQRMVRKGLYTPSQADSDQSRLQSAEISLRKVQGDLDIYRKFELEKNVTKKWSDVKEAERDLKKKRIQADSKMEKAKADEASKKSILDQETDRLRDMKDEEKFYRIISPQEGMVVFFIPEQSRGGQGSQQSIVAQGEPVREGQKLIRIPNLGKMLVNVRVHEAMSSKVFGEKIKLTGYSDRLRGAFTLGQTDPFGLAGYQFGFDEMREAYFKDKDQIALFAGQKAYIRIDAFPGKQYFGNVKTVATVASSVDFFASDVKVYQTMVTVNSAAENLKPGMSAEVTIVADETTDAVLVIPIQSVVGNISMGAKRKCFVLDASGIPQERDIVVGKSNDKMVEVRSGLEVDEKVVQNPRPLIAEKSDMKPGTPGTRRGSSEFGDDGGAAAKKDKKGSKKGPPPGLMPDSVKEPAVDRQGQAPPQDRIPVKK